LVLLEYKITNLGDFVADKLSYPTRSLENAAQLGFWELLAFSSSGKTVSPLAVGHPMLVKV
jgi:hypothetical protein